MCGIICEIRHSECSTVVDAPMLQRIKNRGPNCFNMAELHVDGDLQLFFCGAVLWMQGSVPVTQPLENNHGVLLFNGDILDDTWDRDSNDTELIMDKLINQGDDSDKHIISQLKSLKGPFSLIYYDKKTNNMYFTRDRIGRSSLLFYKKGSSIVISSVMGRNYNCTEIPATNIHKLNLKTLKITLYSWDNVNERQHLLEDWLKAIQKQQHLPDDQFTFEFNSSIDLTDKDGVTQAIQSVCKKKSCKISLMQSIMENSVIKHTVECITNLLEKSVKIRLKTQPNKCKNCIKYTIPKCNHCTVGILFSGGLDCTILALLADKYVEKDQPIDLINVAFNMSNNLSYDVPDRITGKQSYEELKSICSSRQWMFKEVNVTKEKLEIFQKSTIADLVFPRNTVLDESLGSALWFAASGQSCDTSPCRVLLLGSGADELFGGYLRHRKAYQRQGWLGLAKELELDWKRISFRNLSRDNRVICDHGRQPRMPYLDEDFVNYVRHLKPWLRCFPSESLDCGVGDKLMLRLVALNLGLNNVVTYPKRALQFGSRIANKKQKGQDLSKNIVDY